MKTSRLDFSGASNIINPEAELAKTFQQTGSNLNQMIAQSAEKKRAEEALKQQAIENQMAREGMDLRKAGLTLQEAEGQRAAERAKMDADKYTRDVTEDAALRTYTQQLGNYGSNVVPDADAVAIQKAYAANPNVDAQAMVNAAQNRYNADTVQGAQSRIDMLNRVAMPSGEYDPTKLIQMREKAVAKPQGTLDAIASAKAAEQARKQKFQDDIIMAEFKESIKKMKPAAKVDEYNRLLAGGMPEAQAQLLVWGDKNGKGSSGKDTDSQNMEEISKLIGPIRTDEGVFNWTDYKEDAQSVVDQALKDGVAPQNIANALRQSSTKVDGDILFHADRFNDALNAGYINNTQVLKNAGNERVVERSNSAEKEDKMPILTTVPTRVQRLYEKANSAEKKILENQYPELAPPTILNRQESLRQGVIQFLTK